MKDEVLNSAEEAVSKRSYSFPIAEAISLRFQSNFSAKSHDEILEALVRVSNLRNKATGQRVPYEGKVRNLFCALSLELNERTLLAPRFRQARRPAKHNFLSDDEKDLSSDRQVIDLHWLHCRKIVKSISKPEYSHLLQGANFDFDCANRFAAENDKGDTKVRWLKLADEIAWELAALETKYMRDRFGTLMHGKYQDGKRDMYGIGEVQVALETAAARRKGMDQRVQDWSMLWLVNRLIGQNSTPALLSQLWALATGRDKVPDPSQTKRTLVSVLEKIRTFRPDALIAT